MKNHLFLILLSLLSLTACNSTTQFDVIIQNKTTRSLKVIAKTNQSSEQSMAVPAGKNQLIISSPNIPNEQIDKVNNPCVLVAESIQVFDEKGNPSNIKWCDKNIAAIPTDIGQTEYVITVDEDSFQ